MKSKLLFKKGSLIFVFIIFTLCSAKTFAQQNSRQDISAKTTSGTMEQQSAIPSFPTSQIALEGPVNPQTYIVGPSDVFIIEIGAAVPITSTLQVTPEGTIIIPTVGEIRISDFTLAEAKKIVIAAIKRKYISGEPTFTLFAPRPVVIIISGLVRNSGTYTFRATNRVDEAIAIANTVYESSISRRGAAPDSGSTRNIILRHRDGASQRVDIPKYYATKEEKWNPTLREGDEIFIPRTERDKNIIAVYGGVNTPGQFEFVEEESILDALNLAYGFSTLALKDTIYHERMTEDLKSVIRTPYSYADLIDGKIKDVILQTGDRITVREQIENRLDYRVTVKGEVNFPGVIPITRSSTYLSEIIEKAGGFTKYASLSAAEVIRSTVTKDELELERLMSLRGSVSAEDSASYFLETNLRLRHEIVNADFQGLFVEKDKSKDIIIRSNDIINIPSIRKTIYVFGQVVKPGNIPFIENKDADYYIEKAGGFTDRARTGEVSVIKRSTRQWLKPSETTVEEGDQIWIPKKPDYTFSYYMNIIGQTASILSVAISIVLLVVQINK